MSLCTRKGGLPAGEGLELPNKMHIRWKAGYSIERQGLQEEAHVAKHHVYMHTSLQRDDKEVHKKEG